MNGRTRPPRLSASHKSKHNNRTDTLAAVADNESPRTQPAVSAVYVSVCVCVCLMLVLCVPCTDQFHYKFEPHAIELLHRIN